MGEARNVMQSFMNSLYNVLDGPVTFFREKIVEPNQQKYPWYHQKFRRVPTIDQCYTDDMVCQFESDSQYRRDKMVDNEILNILRQRFEDCVLYEGVDHKRKCAGLWETYTDASTAWFTKYGDLGFYENSRKAYLKQKHRMIWERRYGPVGTGMNPKE